MLDGVCHQVAEADIERGFKLPNFLSQPRKAATVQAHYDEVFLRHAEIVSGFVLPQAFVQIVESHHISLNILFSINLSKNIFFSILRFLPQKTTSKYIFFLFNKLKINFEIFLSLARCWLCCKCNDAADAAENTVLQERIFRKFLAAVSLQGECRQDYKVSAGSTPASPNRR